MKRLEQWSLSLKLAERCAPAPIETASWIVGFLPLHEGGRRAVVLPFQANYLSGVVLTVPPDHLFEFGGEYELAEPDPSYAVVAGLQGWQATCALISLTKVAEPSAAAPVEEADGPFIAFALDGVLAWLFQAAHALDLPLVQDGGFDDEIVDTRLALTEVRTYDAPGRTLATLLLETIRWFRDPVPPLARAYEKVHGTPPPEDEAALVQEGLLLGYPVRQAGRRWMTWTVTPWPQMRTSWRGVAAIGAPDPWSALVTAARAATGRAP